MTMLKIHGDQHLSKWFILLLFLWALFVGEIFPVWMQAIEGVSSDAPGAKESMFSSWSMFIPTVIIYTLLSIMFWWLFRKLHWLVVAIIAMTIGTAMEFLLFKPQEASGPNVSEDPLGSLIFFLVIWPILLVVPYWLFRAGRWFNTRFLNKS